MSPTAQLTPHHAERIDLHLAGTTIAALDTHPGVAGPTPSAGEAGTPAHPTVLLVPGFTGSKEDFAPLLDPLRDNGFRAIAIDLPGQHDSPGPDDEAAYRPASLGKIVAELVADVPGPVVLLGHSYGGLVARAAVLHGARPAGLVLLCSGPAALPAGRRRDAMLAGEPLLRAGGLAAAWQLRAALSETIRPQSVPADLQEFYRSRFLASSPAGLIGMAAGLQHEPDLVTELDAALAAAPTPVAVIAGAADDAWSIAEQTDMAQRLGTTLRLIPGSGHSPNVEAPAGLLAVLLPLLRDWTRST